MTLLSICIPVFAPDAAIAGTLRRMLQRKHEDFEILIADFTGDRESRFAGLVGDIADTRLRLMTPARDGDVAPPTDLSTCWNQIVAETRGGWITFVAASDYADPGICEVIRATLKRVPQADALSWGRAAYVLPAARTGQEIARIPTGSLLTLPE